MIDFGRLAIRYLGAAEGIVLGGAFLMLVAITGPLAWRRRHVPPLHSREAPLQLLMTAQLVWTVVSVVARVTLGAHRFPCGLYVITLFTLPVGVMLPPALQAFRHVFRVRLARTRMAAGSLTKDTRALSLYGTATTPWAMLGVCGAAYLLHGSMALLDLLLSPGEIHLWSAGCSVGREWSYFVVIGVIYWLILSAAALAVLVTEPRGEYTWAMLKLLAFVTTSGVTLLSAQFVPAKYVDAASQWFPVDLFLVLLCWGVWGPQVLHPLRRTWSAAARGWTRTDVEALDGAHMDLAFSDVLSHLPMVQHFKDYLLERGHFEFLAFWSETGDYRAIGDDGRRRKALKRILERYIADDAESSLNCGETMPTVDTGALLEQLRVCERDHDAPDRQLLDDARDAVFEYMEDNLYPQFRDSAHYARMVGSARRSEEHRRARRLKLRKLAKLRKLRRAHNDKGKRVRLEKERRDVAGDDSDDDSDDGEPRTVELEVRKSYLSDTTKAADPYGTERLNGSL